MDKYKNIIVFEYTNMSTAPFREIQNDFENCRFVLGKRKVMQKAFGDCEENSYK